MDKDIKNKVPKLNRDIVISEFNNTQEFLVTIEVLEYRMVIDKKTRDIIALIDGKNSLELIVKKYNDNKDLKLNLKTANELIYKRLALHGIVEDKGLTLKKKERASYLRLSFILIKKKTLNLIIDKLSFLLSVRHFYKVLVLVCVVNVLVIYANYHLIIKSLNTALFDNILLMFLTSGGILFFHEFGHAIACKKLGAKPGEIGFGFYILTPVMFADVSDIWKLEKRKRIKVNLSGIYMEVLIGFILAIFYLITNNIILLVLNAFIVMRVLINLNPFLRYDGYWILSDSIDVPNLRKVSHEKLKQIYWNITKKGPPDFTKKTLFLAIYALISVAFIFGIILYILLNDPDSLFSFPVDIYQDVKKLVTTGNRFSMNKYILPFLFYFIVIKYLINAISKNLGK